MKNVSHYAGGAVLALFLTGSPASAGELTTATLDGGGGRVSGGAVEMDASFGGFAAVSDGAAGGVTARAGFPGQLYDPAGLTIAPDSAMLEEFTSVAFAAELRCDDDSLLPAVAGAWSVNTSLLTVSPDGVVAALALPDHATATLTAVAGAYEGTAQLLLLNNDPDNYGPYAGDGLPDAWQTLHFGEQGTDAGPAGDPDADGQDNLTEYLAGTDPLDAAAFLVLRFGPDPAPDTKLLVFTPFLPDRSYSLEWADSLTAPWTASPGSPAPGAEPGEGQFIEAPGEDIRKFYRLRITIP